MRLMDRQFLLRTMQPAVERALLHAGLRWKGVSQLSVGCRSVAKLPLELVALEGEGEWKFC